MKIKFPIHLLLSTIICSAATNVIAQADMEPQASELVSQLNLDEADSKISQHPRWAPNKILIMEHQVFGGTSQEIREKVRQVTGDAEVIFTSIPSVLSTPGLLDGVDAIIGICSPELLAAADDSLVWVHNYFVGMELCASSEPEDIEGRVFTNSQRLSAPTISEHVIALTMSLARNFPSLLDAQRRQEWDSAALRQLTFGEISGKTMLIAGLGGVGTEVAKRAHGLGMRVIATRNSSRTGPEYVEYVGLSDELFELAAQADIVVNALPLTDKTENLFDRNFFDAIKQGAIYVNVGRGKTTNTADLIDAIESGKLYGVGLDVTDPEPLPADSPLWTMDNVIITPHIAIFGGLTIDRSTTIVLENLRRYIEGEALLSPVDLEQGY